MDDQNVRAEHVTRIPLPVVEEQITSDPDLGGIPKAILQHLDQVHDHLPWRVVSPMGLPSEVGYSIGG
jgi:hypothetical protein